jgi:hypothetical protein
MVAKDILRIALFIMVAIFALRSTFRTRVRGSVRINNPAEEDTETQELFQHLQGNRMNQEPVVYENQTDNKEI